MFGEAAEITGKDKLILNNISETDGLKKTLISKYPALGKIQFAVAVNQKLISENTPLLDNYKVAVLPPFSGG